MSRSLSKVALQRKIYKLEQEAYELKKHNKALSMALTGPSNGDTNHYIDA